MYFEKIQKVLRLFIKLNVIISNQISRFKFSFSLPQPFRLNIFIAGGAGVTPFISIFWHLESKNEIGNNKLIFANKKKEDIILEKEFKKLLGDNFINILSDEKVKGYSNGQITTDFIKANSGGTNKFFYLCGPPPMMKAIEKELADLQVDKKSIVKESF